MPGMGPWLGMAWSYSLVLEDSYIQNKREMHLHGNVL